MGKPYFIITDGRLVRKENTVYFESSEVKKALPVEDIDELFVIAELSLTTKLLKLLAGYGIPLHIFNHFGFYVGSFYPRDRNESGFLIVKQVQHYLDDERRIYLAKAFVEGSIRNLAHIYHLDPSSYLKRLSGASNVEEIMSVESSFRKVCYRELEKITGLEFGRRTRRPPENPLNALISFGNSLTYSKVLGEIYYTPLNPTISYLHEPSTKRYSLALDVAEVFKPILCDSIIVKLAREGKIKESLFREDLSMTMLSEEGKKVFVGAFNETLERTIRYRKLKRKVSIRGLIRIELYKLIKHLLEEEVYRPFFIGGI